MNQTVACFILGLILVSGCDKKPTTEKSQPPIPNIVLILADDLGYGDVSSLNPDSKIATPNIDQLMSQGMSFSDAHSNSAVCTPTRYGLLTGEYAWRSRLKKGVLLGYSPSLIPEDKSTLATSLKNLGFATACIGKWHLGLDWKLADSTYLQFPDNQPVSRELVAYRSYDSIDFSANAKGGPVSAGFDYSYIIPASLDFEPYCYLENNLLVEPLDAETAGSDLDTGYTGAFWRPGKMSSSFVHDQVLPTFIDKSIEYIRSRENQPQPFFLYLPLNAPHTPWLPTGEFQESSESGTYGDFVQMVDSGVGSIMQQLKASGFDQNTLVIFTSDNGGYWRENMIEKFGHRSNYYFRGMKADIFEGGHRIPLVVKLPGVIPENSSSDQTVCLTDLYNTIQQVVGDEKTPRPKDSYGFQQILTGNAESNHRPPVVHHSSQGMFGIRSGHWKMIDGLGSGGFTEPTDIPFEDGMPKGQLYNLKQDLAETENMYFQQQDLADSLLRELQQIREL